MRLVLFIFFSMFSFATAAIEKRIIRVGHFPTITHAPGVIGHGLTRKGEGWFERRLGPEVEIQWFVYNDGPGAMEALLVGSLDLVYAGPAPTVNAYVKSEGKALKIICGSCNKGAALVVQPGSIKIPRDFLGKKIATPQFGNTQDLAARFWLKSNGFQITLTGGDAMVIPISGASQLALFMKKDIDAVWTIEPWVSRIVLEAGGEVYLEESAIWPETNGQYVTVHLVSSRNFLEQSPDLVQKWVLGQVELIRWMNRNSEKAKRIMNDELKAEIMKPLSEPVLDRAWSRVEFSYNPVPRSLFKTALQAFEIGTLKKKPDIEDIYDFRFLDWALNNETDL